jgi:hypothetical protein
MNIALPESASIPKPMASGVKRTRGEVERARKEKDDEKVEDNQDSLKPIQTHKRFKEMEEEPKQKPDMARKLSTSHFESIDPSQINRSKSAKVTKETSQERSMATTANSNEDRDYNFTLEFLAVDRNTSRRSE